MSKRTFITAALLATLMAAPAARAGDHTYTASGAVNAIEAGWAADTMAVFHNAAFVNPAGCAVTNAGYATLPTDTGRDLYHTLLLSALLNGKRVQMLIHGTACAFGKPRVIAVRLVP